jgi:DNA-binding transcriptional regulator GbsR (MarR family)
MQATASNLEAEYLRTRDPDTWRRHQLFDGMARILAVMNEHTTDMSLSDLATRTGLSVFRLSLVVRQMRTYGIFDRRCG